MVLCVPYVQSINIRAFFGSIPKHFGNRGESTVTKLPMRKKQWQKRHTKDQTTANLMTVCVFFYEVGTTVWPREFYHLKNSGGKIPVAIPRLLLRKKTKKTPSFDSPSFVLWCFPHCLFLIGNVVSKANSRGKIPVAVQRFLHSKKKTPSFDSPLFGLPIYGVFAIVFPSLVLCYG